MFFPHIDFHLGKKHKDFEIKERFMFFSHIEYKIDNTLGKKDGVFEKICERQCL